LWFTDMEKSGKEENEDFFSSEFWQHLLTIDEAFIYKIPPLATASGHRAEMWDLANPLFTGSLKCAQNDMKLRVVLFTPDGQEFGTCPIQVEANEEMGINKFVESVVDSSRYFVLRLQDKVNANRTAMIGVGFRERESSFDFKSVLNEYVRYVDRTAKAEQITKEIDILGLDSTESTDENGIHGKDGVGSGDDDINKSPLTSRFAMKSGEKINVKITKPRIKGIGDGRVTGGFLKPPPAPGSTVFGTATAAASTTTSVATVGGTTTEGDDEEWGDFQ
jgi:hypothetical protein